MTSGRLYASNIGVGAVGRPVNAHEQSLGERSHA